MKVSDKELASALKEANLDSSKNKTKGVLRPVESYNRVDLRSMAQNPLFSNERRMTYLMAYTKKPANVG
jgi:hypothetical protein